MDDKVDNEFAAKIHKLTTLSFLLIYQLYFMLRAKRGLQYQNIAAAESSPTWFVS